MSESLTMRLSCSANFAALRVVRAMVEAMYLPMTTDASEVHQLVQATDEAVTNSIVHASKQNHQKPIDVEFRLQDREVEIRIEDEGTSFAFDPAKKFDIDEYMAKDEIRGGLGLHLIRLIADHVDYRSENGRNILTMKRRLRGAPKAA